MNTSENRDEVEITPEMLKAGATALSRLGIWHSDLERAALDVFETMMDVHNANRKK